MNSPILLTGASGFLGEYLLKTLSRYSQVKTLGRSSSNNIQIDLACDIPKLDMSFDWVVHNAGKAHVVPKNEVESQQFDNVNYKGTLNLLTALEQNLPQKFIFISTVAVYGREVGEDIDENAPTNGKSPYAKSKIKAERAIRDWCSKNEVDCIILRLPIIVGKNPPGNLNSIINAIGAGKYFSIQGNHARKSMILAEDIANLIPNLKGKSGVYNLTDGIHPTFSQVELAIAMGINSRIRLKLPKSLVGFVAKVGDLLHYFNLPFPLNSDRLHKMTSTLTFSDNKARKELGWNSQPVLPFLEKGLFK